MYLRVLHYFLDYVIPMIAALAAGVAMCWDGSRRSSRVWSVIAILGLALIARTVYASETVSYWGADFAKFWMAGDYAREGKDPYTVKGLLPPNDDRVAFLHPPSTLPLFRLFALAPLRTATILWAAINVLIGLGLGLMTRRCLIALDSEAYPVVERSIAVLLTMPIILSQGTSFCIDNGQLSLLVTLALIEALATRSLNPDRPIVPAAWLAVASMKVQTMVPFLLLFLRGSDRRNWLYLGLLMAAMLLGSGDPAELPKKVSSMLAANVAAREPGYVNDYSMKNHMSQSMIGFEHVLSRIGVADRSRITTLSLLCILVLGGWLAYLVVGNPDIPRGACCSLVSLYSMLFFYHRLYDLPILIIPLVYSASRFRSSRGIARCCHAWVMGAVILTINLPQGLLYDLQIRHQSNAVVRAIILPLATYLILAAMGSLATATFLESRRKKGN